MKSIEKAALLITTPYTFHCEEDWEFYDYGFIEKSFEILDKDPSVVNVLLRGYDENRNNSGITIDFTDRGGFYYTNVKLYNDAILPRVAGVLSFNPGLRTTKDEQAFIPYSEQLCEGSLGYLFYTQGRHGAVTNNSNGYVRHIGWGRHVY